MTLNVIRRHPAYGRLVRSIRMFLAGWLGFGVSIALSAAVHGLFPSTRMAVLVFVMLGVGCWVAPFVSWLRGLFALQHLKHTFLGLELGGPLRQQLTLSLYRDVFERGWRSRSREIST